MVVEGDVTVKRDRGAVGTAGVAASDLGLATPPSCWPIGARSKPRSPSSVPPTPNPDAPTLAPDSAARLSRRMHELRAQLGAEAARVVQAGSRRPRTEIVASALDALADD